MVVVEPHVASSSPPPLFGILHNAGDPIATLRVEEYSWWTLGATCVDSVVSLLHKHLEGRWFSSLSAAAQHVHQTVCEGKRTVPMRAVQLYVRGERARSGSDLAQAILDAAEDARALAHESLAHAHADCRVQSFATKVPGAWNLPIGKGRPYIPHDLSRESALNASVWASYTPSIKTVEEEVAASDSTSTAVAVDPAAARLNSGGGGESGEASGTSLQRRKRKREKFRKPCTQRGGVVWEDRAMGVPPVALVVLDVYEDPGNATREYSTSLHVESLEADPRRMWKCTREVSNFDQQLRVIYTERRALLEARGVWEQTVAMVKRGILQRLLLEAHRGLTMSQLWERPGWLAMGEEPCPVSDPEAAKWLAARRRADSILPTVGAATASATTPAGGSSAYSSGSHSDSLEVAPRLE